MVPTCRIDDQCEPSEYCFEAEDGTKRCRSGCREDGCEEGRTCDLTLRVCVRDTSCEDDEGCFFGEYCDDGMCVDGCRLNDAEACPRNEDYSPTACDPETRACEVVVCCDEEQQCSYAFADECQDAVDGARVCGGNTNPCEGRGLVDTDCSNRDYCNTEIGRCEAGCREDGRGCTEGRANPETRLCSPKL